MCVLKLMDGIGRVFAHHVEQHVITGSIMSVDMYVGSMVLGISKGFPSGTGITSHMCVETLGVCAYWMQSVLATQD